MHLGGRQTPVKLHSRSSCWYALSPSVCSPNFTASSASIRPHRLYAAYLIATTNLVMMLSVTVLAPACSTASSTMPVIASTLSVYLGFMRASVLLNLKFTSPLAELGVEKHLSFNYRLRSTWSSFRLNPCRSCTSIIHLNCLNAERLVNPNMHNVSDRCGLPCFCGGGTKWWTCGLSNCWGCSHVSRQ